jgi:hypothetical protein
MKVIRAKSPRSAWLIPLALLVAAVLLLIATEATDIRAQVTPAARVTGAQQTVFDWSSSACEPRDYPDTPVNAFRDFRGRVQVIASHFVTRRLIGPDLDHLRHYCHVAMSSDNDPHPSRFQDREWISATYTRNGKKIYALVHNEYHGDEHPGRCPSGQLQKCWWNSITLAISKDGGRSFKHARPPKQLVATSPYPYVPDSGPVGLFSPSNIVYRSEDRHYYTLVRATAYRDQRAGVCLLRARHLSDPKSWRAWNGKGFKVKFDDPYRGRAQSPLEHVCQPVSPEQGVQATQSLTYNTYFNKYMLVGRGAQFDRQQKRTVPGVYFSLSSDLIHWSEKRLIMEAEFRATFRCGDQPPIVYPAILDPSSRSRNFATTGQDVYLYFTRYNTYCGNRSDRDLVRIPIQFFK